MKKNGEGCDSSRFAEKPQTQQAEPGNASRRRFVLGSEFLQAQDTPEAARTDRQRALLAQPRVAQDLGTWDSFAAAREKVLATARTLDKNLVVLAGDSHNAWASDLKDAAGNRVGVEFATPCACCREAPTAAW